MYSNKMLLEAQLYRNSLLEDANHERMARLVSKTPYRVFSGVWLTFIRFIKPSSTFAS
jgi:hypothetical protein